jgi:hypothetical protein
LLADLKKAREQFEENVRLLGPQSFKTHPEQFNLYMGLANLAGAMEQLARQVSAIQSDLQSLRRS